MRGCALEKAPPGAQTVVYYTYFRVCVNSIDTDSYTMYHSNNFVPCSIVVEENMASYLLKLLFDGNVAQFNSYRQAHPDIEVDLRSVVFPERLDLSGIDLHAVDFEGATLANLILKGADLRDAKLLEANLNGSMLCGADLRGVQLDGCTLEDVCLAEAKLPMIDLALTDLSVAHLTCPVAEQMEGVAIEVVLQQLILSAFRFKMGISVQ